MFRFKFQKNTLPNLLRPRECDETWRHPIIYMKGLACQIYWYSILLAVITMLQKGSRNRFDQSATVGKELILQVVSPIST